MTGLQWAVLTAYARTLPTGSAARCALDEATAAGTPAPAAQRVALEVARQSGMVEGGRVTEWGRSAARVYLSRLGIPAKRDL